MIICSERHGFAPSKDLLDRPLGLAGDDSEGAEPRALVNAGVEFAAESEPLLVLEGRSSSLSDESRAKVRDPSTAASLPPRDVPELMLPAFKNGSVTI